jgi:signal transduction histidine kinase
LGGAVVQFILQNSLWLVPVFFFLFVASVIALLVVLRMRPAASSPARAPLDEVAEAVAANDPGHEAPTSEAERLRMVTEAHAEALQSLESLISEAEGASYGATTDPLVAYRAAESIADSARVTLNSVKKVVSSSGEVKSVGSEPTISGLTTLFQALEESSIPVSYQEIGTAFSLPAEAELEVYRILQECLNNCRMHGGPGTAVSVELSWTAQGLRLRVDDDGARAARRFSSGELPAPAQEYVPLSDILSGRGMTNMKNRAEALGGVFSAHRIPGVGFSVSVAFPTLKFQDGFGPGSSEGPQPR